MKKKNIAALLAVSMMICSPLSAMAMETNAGAMAENSAELITEGTPVSPKECTHQFVRNNIWEPSEDADGQDRFTCSCCGIWYNINYTLNDDGTACLVSVWIPESYTDSNGDICNPNDLLTEIVLPDYVGNHIAITTTEQYVLDPSTTKLEKITFPSTLKSIGAEAFSMSSLKNVVIPGNVETIGSQAFHQNNNLKTVTIENGVSVIKAEAFDYCDNLTDVTIPDSVTTIENFAFFDDDNLKVLRIPFSVTSIGEYVLGVDIYGQNYSDFTCICHPGSAAETYCKTNGLTVSYESHSFGAWQHDETSHWRSCTICGYKESKAHSGGTATTTTKAVCSVCGAKYGELKKEEAKTPVSQIFKDVPANSWYNEYVQYVYDNGLMTGLDSTTFGPTSTLSRAQFAVILWRMNASPAMTYTAKFPDVPKGTWYTDAVLWANSVGVVTGYGSGKFGPSDKITREQMALMMYRYANYRKYDTSTKISFGSYKDASTVSSYAKEAMQWAVGMGIITGKQNGTALEPKGKATRAECATIITRFMKAYE